MGVDYGDARTGLSLNAGTFAFGAGCIRCEGMKKTVEAVAAAAKEKKADILEQITGTEIYSKIAKKINEKITLSITK